MLNLSDVLATDLLSWMKLRRVTSYYDVASAGVLCTEMVIFCLSNRKFEKLGGPLDEIVTVFVHKYNVIMPRPNWFEKQVAKTLAASFHQEDHKIAWSRNCRLFDSRHN